MGPFKIKPPGTRYLFPRTGAYRRIMFRRLNLPNWPPEDASPLHPIEPWGKQFFVFNAFEACDIKDWSGPRGHFPRLPPVEGPSQDAAAAAASSVSLLKALQYTPKMKPCRTVMCVTDYTQRPLMYLSKDDFLTVAKHVQQLKDHLEEFRKKLPPDDLDAKYAFRRRLLPYKTYDMQSTKTGRHDGHATKRGTIRLPKT